jgi:Brp/Blh family beta-carotene 15,15'-monooxygenase
MALETLIANFGIANLVAVMAVVVIGLPHGAFDGAVATYLGHSRRLTFFLGFAALYIGLAILFVCLWLLFPAASLIMFLAISIIHFGFGDARVSGGWFRWVQTFAHGGVVVAGISQSHRAAVDKVFAFLSGDMTSPVWIAIDIFSAIMVVSLGIYGWRALRTNRWRAGFLELSLLLILFSQVPPLVGFAFYFCCIHSPRHMRSIWQSVQTIMLRRTLYTQALLLTLVSWSAGGVAWWWCALAMPLESALLRVVFIGLAGLTVPHMVLSDGLFRLREAQTFRKAKEY